ncbi:MAG: diguanylate cyclase [Lachnospiraceae bacterium]|nr:diguanylate cyclase [Lachnospiraceae bacterium]
MLINRNRSISLKNINLCLILVVVVMSGIVMYADYLLASSFERLTEAQKKHYEMENAAHELMDASDYLTENVQRFTVSCDRKYMDRYFTEAFETRRRETALAKMSEDENTKAAFNDLQDAMDNSVALMEREYYAMRLVVDAMGYTGYDPVLDKVVLSPEDDALDQEDKIRRATEIVLSDDYFEQKAAIRRDMHESIEEIDKLMEAVEKHETSSLNRKVKLVYTVLAVQVISILFMLGLASRLGIKPVLTAVEKIKSDDPIPESGASEFIYLARAYNKMYERYRNSLEKLNYKASHDELTGAYNRAGYDIMLSSVDLKTTYMMLLDVDNFKSINDTYGHEVGDKALIKLVHVLKGVFRDDDYICRIGGDEFVVFMVHSSGMQRRLIESKIEQIVRDLENTDDGLPPISISAGIVNGRDVTDTENLFEKTDKAMYESKKKGKHTYTFYTK